MHHRNADKRPFSGMCHIVLPAQPLTSFLVYLSPGICLLSVLCFPHAELRSRLFGGAVPVTSSLLSLC